MTNFHLGCLLQKAFLSDLSLNPFFNIFMNDLFYLMEGVRINAYADDEQIYDSDKDPVKLEMRIQGHLLEADNWFGTNDTITNPDKISLKQ